MADTTTEMPVQDSKPAPKPAPKPTPAPARGPYSGANPIPTVQEFIERLDIGKKERDEEIDKEETVKKPAAKQETPEAVAPSQPLQAGKGQKVVTDPVTGNEVVIENAQKSMAKEVNDPKVLK